MLLSHFCSPFHRDTMTSKGKKRGKATISMVCAFHLGKSLSFLLSPLRTLINAVYKTKSCDLHCCGSVIVFWGEKWKISQNSFYYIEMELHKLDTEIPMNILIMNYWKTTSAWPNQLPLWIKYLYDPRKHARRLGSVAFFGYITPVDDKLLSLAQKLLMVKLHISHFYTKLVSPLGSKQFHTISGISHSLAMIWNKDKIIQVACYI